MKIIECPRDAMQGIEQYIEADIKAEYINKLLAVGFDTIDFGSFVNPKAVPQMKDTKDVVEELDLTLSNTNLLAIVANFRGAKETKEYDEIKYLGFPFSISETFQQRNANTSVRDAFGTVDEIHNLCEKNSKRLVVYLSMGFGNPYGDPYSTDLAISWIDKLANLEVKHISLADTVGTAKTEDITTLFSELTKKYPKIEFGAHFHTKPHEWRTKIDAAYEAGCRRFDGALKGYGGCPFADNQLVGNMPTEKIIEFADEHTIDHGLNLDALSEAMAFANYVFGG
jgi:hydroxymethylglutaryl-CoA lyase